MSLFNSNYIEEAKQKDVYELCEALKHSSSLIELNRHECYSAELKNKAFMLEDYEVEELFEHVQRGHNTALRVISSIMRERGLFG